ncbi:MAG: extracellular solute-binding protein [Planctomycetes bacterium]|nr:extracellular solute-binding protein [Planctomycetota bacterium]
MRTPFKIVLVLMMAVMLLSACAPAATPPPPAPPQATQPPQIIEVTKIVAGTPVVEVITATPEVKAPPDKIRIWVPGTSGTVADWKYDPVLQAVEQATNTQIEMTFIDWGTFTDKLNASASDGTFPDIVGVVDHTQRTMLVNWIKNGVIAPVEGDVAAAAPNWVKEYADDPSLVELKYEGKVYFQPVGWGSGLVPNMGLIHVRQDLLDKYKLTPPETFDEYFAYLKKCKDSGDGNGAVFSAKLGIGPAINAFVGAYGLPFTGWVKQADGSFSFWAVQPDVKQAVLLFRKMVAEKLVDPAVWELDGDPARAAYVSGKDCSFIFNGGGHIGRIQSDMDLIKKGYIEYLVPALKADSEMRGYTSELMWWGVSMIGANKWNNPVAAARVINYLISTEGYKLTALGIKDRDYTEAADGTITLLPQRTKDGFPTEMGNAGSHPLAAAIVSWVPMEWQNFALLYGKDDAWKARYDAMWQNQIKYQTPSYGLVQTTPKWDAFQATGTELLTRAMVDAAKANSDDAASKIWDKFVSDWMAAGGKDASVEMSDMLKTIYK